MKKLTSGFVEFKNWSDEMILYLKCTIRWSLRIINEKLTSAQKSSDKKIFDLKISEALIFMSCERKIESSINIQIFLKMAYELGRHYLPNFQ